MAFENVGPLTFLAPGQRGVMAIASPLFYDQIADKWTTSEKQTSLKEIKIMPHLGSLMVPGAPCVPAGVTDPSHEFDTFHYGFGIATKNAVATDSVSHPDDGDEARYVDKSATYSKGLKQTGPGLVDLPTFTKFRNQYSADQSENHNLRPRDRLHDWLSGMAEYSKRCLRRTPSRWIL